LARAVIILSVSHWWRTNTVLDKRRGEFGNFF